MRRVEITVDLQETIQRWIRQGHTDDGETQIDDSGRRLLLAVLAEAGCDREALWRAIDAAFDKPVVRN